MFVIDKHATF